MTALLTTQQVSERLNVPCGTLRYWRKMGTGPAWVKLEGTIRYNSSDVDDYITRNTRQPSVRAHVEEQRVHL
jgi:predicted site-specific integrase-resolvase